MASPFGNFIEALGALEYLRQQQEQRTSTAGLQAMQLLGKQGTFSPVPKGQVSPAGNLLGLLPPDQYKVGGNVLQFQPYPEVDVPGYGKLRLPPEEAAKMATQKMENEEFAKSIAASYQGMRQAREPLSTPNAQTGLTGITEEPIAAPVRHMTSQSPPARPGPTRWNAIIEQAAKATGLPPALLSSVMLQESGGNPSAVSPKGAMGLMQLMPGTAAELGVDPNDPVQNVMGGARYLKQQMDAFGGDIPKALAAYNAGPGAVQKYGGIPPYPETQGYVQGVSSRYQGMGGPSQMVAGGQATPRPQILPRDRTLDGEISTIDAQMQAIEDQIVASSKRGTKSKDQIMIQQGVLNKLQARRDRLEDQLSEPAREAMKARARIGPELEMTEKKLQLQTREDIAKKIITDPMDLRKEVQKHELQSDMMTDADKLISKDLFGDKAPERYSELKGDMASQLRQSRQEMEVDTFVTRATAQAEILDGRQRKSKQRDAMADLGKSETVIDQIYKSWQQYTNPKSGILERGRAGMQMRKLTAGLGGTLGKLVDKGILSDQDKEKAEALLPGLITGVVDPTFGEQNFNEIRTLLGTWKGVINDTYGASGAAGSKPAEKPVSEMTDDELKKSLGIK